MTKKQELSAPRSTPDPSQSSSVFTPSSTRDLKRHFANDIGEAENGSSGLSDDSFRRLMEEWNETIDNFVEEWRTMTIISTMLVP
jgi:hypothetical protein